MTRALDASPANSDVPPLFWDEAQPGRVLRGLTRSFVTYTAALFPMLDELELAAGHDVTLLLEGETGTGKTFLAGLVHELSTRRHAGFLPVCCGALAPDLIESELFGHVQGAFTGAERDKEGKFAAASAGTLLLDEIDVLTLDQQAKLLRVIETGEFEPVGSNETQRSHARLIVASNTDLEELVRTGRFRRDLYYRLEVLKFNLPPLRQRPLDVLALAGDFADRFSTDHGIAFDYFEQDFLRVLQQYSWPGNVRELQNVIRRAVLFCQDGVLRLYDLPDSLCQRLLNGRANGSAPGSARGLKRTVAVAERTNIERALHRYNNNRTAAARYLGISRVTLYNKLKKYGITG